MWTPHNSSATEPASLSKVMGKSIAPLPFRRRHPAMLIT
jgi:hypothetical protein